MTNEELRAKYDAIWDNPKYQSNELIKRGYNYQFDEDAKSCDLLFIGINPSFDGTGVGIRGNYSRNDVTEKTPSYFKPFIEISSVLKSKVQWTHLDLFVFKETKQDEINKKLFKSDDGLSFLVDQLNVARERIEHIHPKVIVVSNALARTMIGKDVIQFENKDSINIWMGLKLEFDNEVGTDKIIEGPLKGTYVFFTSMLSGQRALDNGSKERLIWHINQVLKK